MTNRDGVALADAKRFQGRDYIVDFVADRLEGLWLIARRLSGFGLKVRTSKKYIKHRKGLVTNRARWINRARDELTEALFESVIQNLQEDPFLQIEILDGLFVIERKTDLAPRTVLPKLTYSPHSKESVEWCLSRLNGPLRIGLNQIKDFMAATETNPNHAIVFLSGVEEWQTEWNQLWNMLDSEEQWAWDRVAKIKEDADQFIRMPFELIVGRYKKIGEGRYGPIEYHPFSWRPNDSNGHRC